MRRFIPLLSLLISLPVAHAATLTHDDVYSLTTIEFPEGVPPEVGALGFNELGELVVALRRSDVLIGSPTDNPAKFEWRRFAKGLHNAAGMHIVSTNELVISQMAELTRITDTDGDGVADLYENINNDWGMSGNYHETIHLTPDGEGGYFLAVGTASHNGPVFYNVRGEYSKIGRRGRNYSAVSYKGWTLHVDADGNMTPWCMGFRMHNGILLDSNGNLWAGDNQGDWRATTPFYHLQKGHFYGHPSALIWGENWEKGKDPLLMSLEEIDAMRTPAAIMIPHEEMNRSASEPIEIPADTFGPYDGQILLPDNNGTRICRLMLEEVDGVFQGAATVWFDGHGLRSGNNRGTFSPDGRSLYIGQTVRGWGQPSEGVQRIHWEGAMPFDVKNMTLTANGFRLEFTYPPEADSIEPAAFQLKNYHYQNTSEYGGPKLDEQNVPITRITRVSDNVIELHVDNIKAGEQVYELALDLQDEDGNELWSKTFAYTVNRLKE